MIEMTHPGDSLVDYVDGRLAAADAERVRAHLDVCAECGAIHRELATARDAARALRTEPLMPADLMASVSRALDAETRRPASTPARALAAAPGVRVHPVWRGLVAAAAVAALVAVYLQVAHMPAPRRLDVPTLAARDLRAVGSPSLPLELQVVDASALERYFAETRGPRVRVIDLGMMNITLEGGLRHALAGQPSALYSYRTPSGARLVCQMYEGRLADLPPLAEIREQNGFRFQVYTRDGVTLVFWQEGELVCVLASELPADEVIALAQAKAMAPA
jgi:anti-sigma factor RsiW